MKTNSQDLTWIDIERLTKLLYRKILTLSKDFTSISTISRGGLIPARLLADHMGIDTILVDKNKIPSSSLFVDDIYDSGDTFKKIIPKVTDPELYHIPKYEERDWAYDSLSLSENEYEKKPQNLNDDSSQFSITSRKNLQQEAQ